MDRQHVKSIVEGLVFASAEPVNAASLAAVIASAQADVIQQVLDELEEEYRHRDSGFLLVRVAGGYQFRTLPKLAPWILQMKSMKPSRLSRAALETLAIVAYNQPITRTGIEQIRGVESAGTVKSLQERNLITVVGRKDIPGRPHLYATTQRFLEVFGLPDLASLPPLPELEEPAEEEGSPG